MRPGKIENFASYSPFASLKDFNDYIDAFWAARKQNFSKGEALAFKRLVRFCAKYPLEALQKDNNRIDDDHDHTYTSDRVPKRFRDLVKCFFDSAETIGKYYQRLHVAAFKTHYHQETKTVLNVGVDSFWQLIGKLKKATSATATPISTAFARMNSTTALFRKWAKDSTTLGKREIFPKIIGCYGDHDSKPFSVEKIENHKISDGSTCL